MRSLRGRCATGLGTRLLLLLGECLLLLSEPDTRPLFLTFTHLPKMKSKEHRAEFQCDICGRRGQVSSANYSESKSYRSRNLKLFFNVRSSTPN